MTQGAGKKHKLAVIGGGISAMTAAFEITSQRGWEELYDVTVYQSGFRLGGKGASGRNRAHADRIEEHGLHIFMGFYENAFHVMRRCYEELDRPASVPIRTWTDAFHPHDEIVLFEQDGGEWKPWRMPFPRSAGTPGDGEALPPIWSYVPMILEAILRTISAFEREGSGVARILDRAVDAAREEIDKLITEVMGDSQRGSVLLRALRATSNAAPAPVKPFAERAPVRLITSVLRAMRRSAEEMGVENHGVMRRWAFDALLPVLDGMTHEVWEAIGSQIQDDHARRTWILVDLMATNVKGMIRDELVFPPFPFEQIDDVDYKEWLRRHGAHPRTVESAPVNAIYDLVFARHAGICAGSALRGSLRMMLAYKGSIFYKMQAGMGDIIFAPLYEVLKQRGVKFRFFHRLDNIRLSPDKKRAAALEFGRQATIKGGVEYEPLFDVGGLPCWPSEPLWEQLVEGEQYQREGVDLESFFDRSHDVEKVVLEEGKDFDAVILGVSIGALPYVASEVIANSPKLQGAVEHIRTTATQAVQLWFRPDLTRLGWNGPSPVAGTFAKPFDTWADMSHLIARESFGPNEVGNIAYLCGHLPDPEPNLWGFEPPPPSDPPSSLPVPSKKDPHPQANQATRAHALDWLGKYVAPLWPRATLPSQPDALDFGLLVDRQDRKGEARIESQYLRASVNPSDRYVMSVPGSSAYRPRTEETNLTNLFVTGDWIKNGIQGGCAEAAVMAGLQTARAICGMPAQIMGDTTPPPPKPLVAALPLPGPEPKKYIERGGEIVLRGPFAQEGTRMYMFLLSADEEKLEALVDRCLNIGRTRYRPVGPFVALNCADIQRIRSLHPEDSQKGVMTERDVAFWIPVVAGDGALGAILPSRVVWFLPYIFVDSPPPMAVGREIYGFPKLAGRIDIHEPEDTNSLVTVDAYAIERFSPTSRAHEQRLVEVRRKADDERGALARLWSALDHATSGFSSGFLEAAEALVAGAGTDALASAFREVSASQVVRMAFLKQFRDTGDHQRACYQSVIEATLRVTAFRAGGPLSGPFEVLVPHKDSHPIAAELGLPDGRVEPLFAGWVDFDFDVDEGEEVP
jgi:uncharacterized protein with NAD-binding domain and iron-sulfur cluster